MKIDHDFTAAVTMVVTACNRTDLLERTLDSFLAFNTYPHVSRIIVVEDSAIVGVNDRLKRKYGNAAVTWVENEQKLGQIASIDKAYALVETPYIFHCEDDWEFYETGFIEASMAVLRADKRAIVVWLRAYGDTNGHPIHVELFTAFRPEGPVANFRLMALDYRGTWHGFTFNPGLRRLMDYRKHFPGGYLQHPGIDPWKSETAESTIGRVYKDLGYHAAIIDLPGGFVRHTGWGRRIMTGHDSA